MPAPIHRYAICYPVPDDAVKRLCILYATIVLSLRLYSASVCWLQVLVPLSGKVKQAKYVVLCSRQGNFDYVDGM